MKVLLADDEFLIRESLKSMLHELNQTIEIVGEATNGTEVLAFLSEQAIDFVFIDIQMPQLNGLDAIRTGKEISPHTEWFILSGYSNFEYAQEAVRLGATDYLLKPIGMEQLQTVIHAMVEKKKSFLLRQNRQFELEMISVFYDLHSFHNDMEDEWTHNCTYKGCLLLADSFLSESEKANAMKRQNQIIRQIIESYIGIHTHIAMFLLPSGEITILAAWKNNQSVEKQHIHSFFERLKEVHMEISSPSLIFSAYDTSECQSLLDLHVQIQSLSSLSALRSVMHIGHYSTYEQVKSFAGHSESLQLLAREIINLVDAFKDKSYMLYIQSCEKLQNLLQQTVHSPKDTIFLNLQFFLKHSISFDSPKCKTIESYVEDLRKRGEKLLADKNKNQNQSDLVNHVISFIESHFAEDIGISQIAEMLNVTPNYLSTLFHKKVGITFVKHLTKIRMLRAKELLLDPTLQIQKIAEQVGYYSSRHFTKLFKEFEGCYPSEYRKKLNM